MFRVQCGQDYIDRKKWFEYFVTSQFENNTT